MSACDENERERKKHHYWKAVPNLSNIIENVDKNISDKTV